MKIYAIYNYIYMTFTIRTKNNSKRNQKVKKLFEYYEKRKDILWIVF